MTIGAMLAIAPLGTRAPAFNGGAWCKVESGWKWNGPDGNGSIFPRPGGDWNGDLVLPPNEVFSQKLFQPAIHMPTTAQEAVAVIEKWGDPTCMTFDAVRARRCAELLFAYRSKADDLLDWLIEHPDLDLSSEIQDGFINWFVHRIIVNGSNAGGLFIARGDTPFEALRNARHTLNAGTKE